MSLTTLRNDAVMALSKYIAAVRVEEACELGEDIADYATDVEVVSIYLNEIAEDVSVALPNEILKLNGK